MTYAEAWNLPIEVRHWWIKRVEKELKGKGQDPNAPLAHVDPFGRKHG